MKTKIFLTAIALPALCGSLAIVGSVIAQPATTARWNPRTTDWTQKPDLGVGDWGFDRPGFPTGLYLHGITVKAGGMVSNPVIYDNDVFDDVFDDEWAFARASARGTVTWMAPSCTPGCQGSFPTPPWRRYAAVRCCT